jgi:hypothetical protein
MHTNLMTLFQMNTILSRGLNGIDPNTGERVNPANKLPPSMFRHLRRVMKSIRDEIDLCEPERKPFADKWLVDGKWPKETDENFAEFKPLFDDLFFNPDITIPFTPFKLELLDKLDDPIPVDLMSLMEQLNEVYESEQKEDNPAKGDSDKAELTATPDV